ncbi:hypothetical protein [Nocardiopsis tropica]|uniref:Uncharacterized protein n=1 Tax=Nocardiopsis tropica TaxID=109330 RepID=A0ABU7KMQ4_9ACTN|nr:hypothetical protein [Nocardiopsis umidischolae]MEE2050294.1 hypothetical protein [Nocardiopsis umidischolae]
MEDDEKQQDTAPAPRGWSKASKRRAAARRRSIPGGDGDGTEHTPAIPFTAVLSVRDGTHHITVHTATLERALSTPLNLGIPPAEETRSAAQVAAELALASQGWTVIGGWDRSGPDWHADLIASPGA